MIIYPMGSFSTIKYRELCLTCKMISVYEHLWKTTGDISLLAKSHHCTVEPRLETSYKSVHQWLLIEYGALVTIITQDCDSDIKSSSKSRAEQTVWFECIFSAEPRGTPPNTQSLNAHPHGSMDNWANISTHLPPVHPPLKLSLGLSELRNSIYSETLLMSDEHDPLNLAASEIEIPSYTIQLCHYIFILYIFPFLKYSGNSSNIHIAVMILISTQRLSLKWHCKVLLEPWFIAGSQIWKLWLHRWSKYCISVYTFQPCWLCNWGNGVCV